MSDYTLNISEFKYRDKQDLMEQITGAVKYTQSAIIRPYPNTLTMNRSQFRLLSKDPDMLVSEKDRLFRTKYNLMEVIVI